MARIYYRDDIKNFKIEDNYCSYSAGNKHYRFNKKLIKKAWVTNDNYLYAELYTKDDKLFMKHDNTTDEVISIKQENLELKIKQKEKEDWFTSMNAIILQIRLTKNEKEKYKEKNQEGFGELIIPNEKVEVLRLNCDYYDLQATEDLLEGWD